MATQYLVQGRNVLLKDSKDNPPTMDTLPLGTYIVQFHPELGYYLEIRDDFKLPPKLYGKTEFRTKRILETFESRPYNTGVLLYGVKGSGKSMEATNISVEGKKKGYSTLIVNAAWHGTGFNKFLQAIKEPFIILFDEFEKVYERPAQESLLTLLDGFFSSKRLCVFTANDQSLINSHMMNRPGRIFYSVKYKGLEPEFILEYCEDILKDKDKIDTILQVAEHIDDFNFDMLKALVEEHNRYGGRIKDLLPMLNINLGYISDVTYGIKVWKDGVELTDPRTYYPSNVRNPMSEQELYLELYELDEKGRRTRDSYLEIPMETALVSRGKKTIQLTKDDYVIVLTKNEVKKYDPLAAIQE